MNATRGAVLERLAAMSDAGAGRTTTVEALAATFGAEEEVVADHLERLRAGELARRRPNGPVRITVTGEELLALDPEVPVVLGPTDDPS